MKPIVKINGRDYTSYVMELTPSYNDLDSDGSGRNILDGLMYRHRVSTKIKWELKFLRLDENVMAQLMQDMYASEDYVSCLMLEPRTNRQVERSYYCSTINNGIQRYIRDKDKTVYDGAAFNLTER